MKKCGNKKRDIKMSLSAIGLYHYRYQNAREVIYIDTIKENRTKYIGGSDIPTLLGYNKNKTVEELIQEYVCNSKTFEGNQYTEYGNLMEDKIRSYFNNEYGFDAQACSILFENRNIRCNTDGLDRDKNIIVEIKTNNGKHTNTFDYELQMQLYMWAFGVNEGYLVQYERHKDFYSGIMFDLHSTPNYFNLEFDSKKIRVKKIERKELIIKQILNHIQYFWCEVNKLKQHRNGEKND